LQGTPRGVDADPLPFPPPSLPRLPLLLHPSHPFLSLLLFPSPRKFSKEVWGSTTVSFPQCPAKRRQPGAKVGGDHIHLVPKVGRDASHGSHIAVAPIVTGLLQKKLRNGRTSDRYLRLFHCGRGQCMFRPFCLRTLVTGRVDGWAAA